MNLAPPDQRGLDPEPDIVLEFIAIARATLGGLTPQQESQLEQAMRAAPFSGRRVRVLKRGKIRHPGEQRNIVNQALQSAERMADVADQNGISRRTLYRYMKKGGAQ